MDENFGVKKRYMSGENKMHGTLCSKCSFATFQCKHVKMGVHDYTQFVLNVEFCRYRVVILPENYHLSLPANTLPHAWADR